MVNNNWPRNKKEKTKAFDSHIKVPQVTLMCWDEGLIGS